MPKEMLDEMDYQVHLAMQGLEVIQGLLEREAYLACLDKKEREELLEHLVQLAHKAHRVNREVLD